jgi:sugar diacid utilization regulator
MAKNDKRHILHNYIEIIKLMIIVIHQKKIENTLKQNQFLLNFVSNLSSSYTNEEIIEASKRYNWQIIFPIILVLFSIHDKHKSILNPNMIEYIRTVIINKFHLNSDEVRYTVLNDQLLFIVNTLETVQINDIMPNVYETLKIKYREFDIKITYSNLIHEASEISKTYFQLSDALVHIKNKNLSINLFTEDQIKLLNLLKNVDYLQMKEYISSVLKPIVDYEKKNQTPLIDTLYQYMDSRFNIKETANKLILHYNTVRYRLDVIESLGFQVLKGQHGQFELYFALYLYRNFESKMSS